MLRVKNQQYNRKITMISVGRVKIRIARAQMTGRNLFSMTRDGALSAASVILS
jgi:hypothetical protein